jgi:hypothetical protein
LSIFLLIILSTFAQFQLELCDKRQLDLHSLKGMRIERDQLFLQLHDVALVYSTRQRLQLLPNLMRVIDSTKVKSNLPRDVGCNDPYNLILLAIKSKLLLVVCWI